ncbi:MAG: DUF2484 family protein [Pseudomonadota bacterium]
MALIALCVWVVVAWVLMVILTAKQSWPAAYCLMAVGAPILVWLWLSMSALWAGLGLAVMGLVLRWPVIYFGRWLRRVAQR